MCETLSTTCMHLRRTVNPTDPGQVAALVGPKRESEKIKSGMVVRGAG